MTNRSFAQQTVTNHSPFTTHNSLKTAFTLAEVFSPHCAGLRKNAFTLAEVLITLGIIGVVAALTIPTLITNYQKQQTVVQLRKVYSDLSNAVKLSEVDNGPMSGWDYPTVYTNNSADIHLFLNRYWLPYFQGAKFLDASELSGYKMLNDVGINQNYIILNSGVIVSFFTAGINYMWILADINGLKGPNKVGRDIFVFDSKNYANINNVYKIKFWSIDGSTIEHLKTDSNYGCNKDNTAVYKNFYCGRMIELSGWKIPDDYPW